MNGMEENQIFEEVMSETAPLEYFKLYNELATQIGIFYDELIGFKSVLRLVEANRSSQKSLKDVFSEIDTTLNKIRTILSSMRQQEKLLIFAANIKADEDLRDYEGFANLYKDRKAEISHILINSDIKLTQIKDDIIDKIKNSGKRMIMDRKWKEYKTDLNELNTEIDHIDSIVKEYAKKVDGKFNVNLSQIINS